MDVFVWLYCSQEVEDFSSSGLDQILSVSRKMNRLHDVTGMLLYRNGNFTQIIEGKKDKILNLKANILRDRRHRNVTTLYQGPHARIFTGWSMAYHQPDAEQQRLLDAYLPLGWDFRTLEIAGRDSNMQALLAHMRLWAAGPEILPG